MQDVQHYLYVIGADEAGPVKLGLSHNPQDRLTKLQTGSPQRYRLFYAEAVDARMVKKLESFLHRDMNHHRVIREWFNLSVAEAIKQVQFTVIHYENELRDELFWKIK